MLSHASMHPVAVTIMLSQVILSPVILDAGSTDFFVETFTADLQDSVALVPDDYGIHAARTTPGDHWSVVGSKLCRGNYPEDYSILVKFQTGSSAKTVTLLNISNPTNGLALTLDYPCGDKLSSFLHIKFGTDCPRRGVMSFQLRDFIDRSLKRQGWHRIGISFSSDGIGVYIDCIPLTYLNFNVSESECRVRPCDEGTTIHLLQSVESAECESDEVRVQQQ